MLFATAIVAISVAVASMLQPNAQTNRPTTLHHQQDEIVKTEATSPATYEDRERGFSFEYPSTWQIVSHGPDLFSLRSPTFLPVFLGGSDYQGVPLYTAGEILITVNKNPERLSIREKYSRGSDWSSLLFKDPQYSPTIRFKDHIEIASVAHYTKEASSTPNHTTHHITNIARVGTTMIEFTYTSGDVPPASAREIMDRIVDSVAVTST